MTPVGEVDPRLVIEAAFAVAAFFAALWIRSVRDELRAVHADMRELVKTVSNHGERLAVLESQMKERR